MCKEMRNMFLCSLVRLSLTSQSSFPSLHWGHGPPTHWLWCVSLCVAFFHRICWNVAQLRSLTLPKEKETERKEKDIFVC